MSTFLFVDLVLTESPVALNPKRVNQTKGRRTLGAKRANDKV